MFAASSLLDHELRPAIRICAWENAATRGDCGVLDVSPLVTSCHVLSRLGTSSNCVRRVAVETFLRRDGIQRVSNSWSTLSAGQPKGLDSSIGSSHGLQAKQVTQGPACSKEIGIGQIWCVLCTFMHYVMHKRSAVDTFCPTLSC